MYFLKNFIRKISLLLIIYFVSRLFFFINNFSSFNINESTSWLTPFLESLRYDLSILLYINSLVLLLIFIPFNLRLKQWYQKLVEIVFLFVNIPFIILNNIDIEFFQYNQKRITSDFVDLLFLGNDTAQVLPSYLLTYWPIVLLTLFQIYILFKHSDFKPKTVISNFKSFSNSLMIFFISIVFFVVGARGGLQLKPINTINAGELSNPIFSNLILNTPFTFLHSFKSEKLVAYNYFSEKELNNTFSLTKNYSAEKQKDYNVIIIIMESQKC